MHTSKEGLRTRIQTRAGTAAVAPASFHTFQNVEENVRHQMQTSLRNQGCLTFRDISSVMVMCSRIVGPLQAAPLAWERGYKIEHTLKIQPIIENNASGRIGFASYHVISEVMLVSYYTKTVNINSWRETSYRSRMRAFVAMAVQAAVGYLPHLAP
jgi:hypothetical protein